MAFAAAETYFVVVSGSSDNTVGNIIGFFSLCFYLVDLNLNENKEVPSIDLLFLHMVQFFC